MGVFRGRCVCAAVMAKLPIVVAVACLAAAPAMAYNPYAHEMELSLVPVPNQVHSPTTMLACVDGMSEECQKILEDVNSKSGPTVSDEDWAYGDGYYLDNFGDIDDMADMGVIEMPYQVDYDLLQSHMIAISGVKPCGACDE